MCVIVGPVYPLQALNSNYIGCPSAPTCLIITRSKIWLVMSWYRAVDPVDSISAYVVHGTHGYEHTHIIFCLSEQDPITIEMPALQLNSTRLRRSTYRWDRVMHRRARHAMERQSRPEALDPPTALLTPARTDYGSCSVISAKPFQHCCCYQHS